MILLKKKRVVACIYFILISQMLLFVSAFSDDLNYVVEFNETLTPFSVMPIFFENVPKDVYSISVFI